jgi:hypothetical protein
MSDATVVPNGTAPLAEQDTIPEPLICDDLSPEHFHERSHCIQCHRIFCPHYASEIDTNFCRVCLTGEAAAVHAQPLKDHEGISHDGKWFLPHGSIYKTLPKAISEMGDPELEEYLRYMKEQVKNAETTLQYRRIAESTAQMEKTHREILRDRRLRGIKLPTSANTGIKVDGAKAPRSAEEKLADVAKTIKAMGITKEMLEALLKAKKG